MSLLNVDDPLPQYLIVMLGCSAYMDRAVPVDEARALLTPPGVDGMKVFDASLSTLVKLGLITRENDEVRLVGPAIIEPDDIVDTLRRAILTLDNNAGVGQDSAQTGPRDLVRALCWFLTNDPTAAPLGWSDVQARQSRAIHEQLGNPITNDTRWNPFCSWASVLGFCTPALTNAGDGSTATRLVADCTTAVRRTVLARWQSGSLLIRPRRCANCGPHCLCCPAGTTRARWGSPRPRRTTPASHCRSRCCAAMTSDGSVLSRTPMRAPCCISTTPTNPAFPERSAPSPFWGWPVVEMSGYLCWTPDAAVSRISTEAVIPSPALFLATHTPLRISRSRLVQRGLVDSGEMVDERTVLKEFAERRADSGALMMPLVGESGSGKSHLVRWVHEHLDPDPQQKVIYLEKTQTSLKAVVTALLADVDDDSLTGLKREVSSFAAEVDAAALARRIVNSLNESLANTRPAGLPAMERGLVGPNGLALVLQDPLFQGYLLKPGGFIVQLAEQLLRDSGCEFSERPRGFTADVLPFEVRDVQAAAAASKRVVGMINTKPGLKAVAIGLLNGHLEAALRSAANLAAGRLSDAFLRVREIYAAQGREILLLIEDFALIQGVQGELLDALTEPAVRHGEQRLAPIRTLMAVTTGYFTDLLPETALTRIGAASGGHVFRLDVTFSKREDEAEQIASFTGRYLNVARVAHDEPDPGVEQLRKNQCDACSYQAECHGRFGRSAEGYGLYPFNRSALLRMVHSTADKAGSFVPRAVLGKVIRPTLVDHALSLEEGTFPDADARRRFPRAAQDTALSTEVSSMLESADDTDVDRQKFVVEFWGDSPAYVDDSLNDILRIFRAPPVATPATDHRPPRPTYPEPRSPRDSSGRLPPTELPARIQSKLDAIERWAGRGDDLDQAVASNLRKILAEAVYRRFLWTNPPMREWTKANAEKAWPPNARTVWIEKAYGQKTGETAPLQFERTAVNGQFFKGLLRSEAVGRLRAVDQRRLASEAESGTVHFAAAVARNGETSDEQLVTGLRAALLGGVLAGRAWPGMDRASQLAVVFDEGRDWARTDADLRTATWNEALARHLSDRSQLVKVLRSSLGVAQGTGETRMVDAARVLPLLQQATAQWWWRPEVTPSWVKGVTGFSNLDAWVAAQLADLRSRFEHIRELLPEQDGGPRTVQAVRTALDEAPRVGLGPATREEDARLRELIEKAGEADWRALTGLGADLRRHADAAADPDRQGAVGIQVAAKDRGPSLGVITEFLAAADRWLSAKLPEATSRTSTEGDTAVKAVQVALQTWSAIGVDDA